MRRCKPKCGCGDICAPALLLLLTLMLMLMLFMLVQPWSRRM